MLSWPGNEEKGQSQRRVKRGTSNVWLRPKGKNDHPDGKSPRKVSWGDSVRGRSWDVGGEGIQASNKAGNTVSENRTM